MTARPFPSNRDILIREFIQAGIEDINEGRHIPHAEVMRDVRAEIDALARGGLATATPNR